MTIEQRNRRGSGQCMAMPLIRPLSGHSCGDGLGFGGSGSAVLQEMGPIVSPECKRQGRVEISLQEKRV